MRYDKPRVMINPEPDLAVVSCYLLLSELFLLRFFFQWKRRPLPEILPDLDDDGIDLLDVINSCIVHFWLITMLCLQRLLHYDPQQRITAKAVMRHPYFRGIAGVCVNAGQVISERQSKRLKTGHEMQMNL